MIIVEQPAETFTTTDATDGAASRVIIGGLETLKRQPTVAQPLVRPLQVVVRHVLLKWTPKFGPSAKVAVHGACS